MIKRHTISFKNAFKGLVWALKTQPNYRIHLFLSTLSIFGGVILKISYPEWLVIILLITMGFSIETINTAIEETTDAIDIKQREDIRIAKDVAAGAMLIFAIGAFIIASIIFLPKISNFKF
jgi:diacylglycerol kinase